MPRLVQLLDSSLDLDHHLWLSVWVTLSFISFLFNRSYFEHRLCFYEVVFLLRYLLRRFMQISEKGAESKLIYYLTSSTDLVTLVAVIAVQSFTFNFIPLTEIIQLCLYYNSELYLLSFCSWRFEKNLLTAPRFHDDNNENSWVVHVVVYILLWFDDQPIAWFALLAPLYLSTVQPFLIAEYLKRQYKSAVIIVRQAEARLVFLLVTADGGVKFGGAAFVTEGKEAYHVKIEKLVEEQELMPEVLELMGKKESLKIGLVRHFGDPASAREQFPSIAPLIARLKPFGKRTLIVEKIDQNLTERCYRTCATCGITEKGKRQNSEGRRIADFKVCRECKKRNFHKNWRRFACHFCSFDCVKKGWEEHKKWHSSMK